MRCVLVRSEPCLFKQCRYFVNNFCSLTVIDESGWPSPDCRFKNTNVQGKEELKEMSIHGPGCITD